MKNEKTIWLSNLELWLECNILPEDHTQPSVNIMSPYQDGDGDWLVHVSSNHDFDVDRYQQHRKDRR